MTIETKRIIPELKRKRFYKAPTMPSKPTKTNTPAAQSVKSEAGLDSLMQEVEKLRVVERRVSWNEGYQAAHTDNHVQFATDVLAGVRTPLVSRRRLIELLKLDK